MINKELERELCNAGWNIHVNEGMVILTKERENYGEIRFWKGKNYYYEYRVFRGDDVIEDVKGGYRDYKKAMRFLKRMACGRVYQLIENERDL